IVRLFSLAFVLGTCALQQEASLSDPSLGLAGIAALLALRLVPIHARAVRCALLLVAGAFLGYGLAAWRAQERLADALPPEWEWRDVEVTGVVSGLPQPTERGVRFVFEVEEVRTRGAHVPRLVSVMWYAEREKGVEAHPPPTVKAA